MAETAKPAALRNPGLRPLARGVGALTRTALGRKGFAEAELIAAWREILGPDLAALATPIRLRGLNRHRSAAKTAAPDRDKGATLVLRAAGAAALEIQHLQPVILERINLHFGYPAIGELRIEQSGRPANFAAGRGISARGKPGVGEPPADPSPFLADIADGELKTRLAALGRAILPAPGKTAKKPG